MANTTGKIKVSQGKDNKYYWALYSGNGRHIANSVGGYMSLELCYDAIALCRNMVAEYHDAYIESEPANIKGGGLQFMAYSEDGKMLAISGIYTSSLKRVNAKQQIIELGCNKGIMAYCKYILLAEILTAV